MKKPIAPEAIPLQLQLLDQMDKQIETAKQMAEALQNRRRTLKEFIHANAIGDRQGFDALWPMLERGCKRPFYGTFPWAVDQTIKRLRGEKTNGQN